MPERFSWSSLFRPQARPAEGPRIERPASGVGSVEAPKLDAVESGSSTTTPKDGVALALQQHGMTREGIVRGLGDALGEVAPAAVDPPKARPLAALYEDPAFGALYHFVMDEVHAVEGAHLEWDTLRTVKSFCAAVEKAQAIVERFPGVLERRAVTHLLLLLMPPHDRGERPMRADGSRGARQDLFQNFPEALLERAHSGFVLEKGDLPTVAPIFTAHLAGDIAAAVFQPGQAGLFLASKRYCPEAFIQDRRDLPNARLKKTEQAGHEGDPIFVRIDAVDGKTARVHVPAQHKVWLGDDGACARGDEVLPRIDTVNGKPIEIPIAHLAKYLLSPGQGTRGLDLNKEEDRAVALAFAHELKSRPFTDSNGITKTLFDWLEQADERTPRDSRVWMLHSIREAAFQAVAKYACHPRRTHFTLDVREPWQNEAWQLLAKSGVCNDCGNYYEKDKSDSASVHEMAWTAAFLDDGFVGGSLDCLGSADLYDKLSKTFLEPLGIISMTGIAEGHGASIQRVLEPPDENGVVQAGIPMKVKQNELILGLDVRLSSGRGPAAQYMENWGGYLRIDGP